MKEKLNKIFLEKLNNVYSKDELDIVLSGFETLKKPVTFRVNTLKSNNEEVEKYLSDKGLKIEKISYLTNGYKLIDGREKDLWDLDIFTEGKIYMQSISSQLIGEIANKFIKDKDLKILDLTAAPGSKTSHLSALLENKGEIVANEINTIRFDKLKFTVERQGCKNVTLVKGDAKDLKKNYIEGFFDMIVADLPCSAEGRINLHNEKTYKFLEKEGINKRNYKAQQDILKNTISLLKVGGVLIYSTCTLDPQENEGIIHFLLSNYPDLELQDISDVFKDESIKKYTKSGIKSFGKYVYRKEVDKSIRLLPSEETEGFFIGVVRKVNI